MAAATTVSVTARAQDSQDFQLWSFTLATADIGYADTPRLGVWLDVHVRRSSTNTVHIARPAVGLHLTDALSLWVGYAWVPVFGEQSGAAVHEHRLWQQMIFQHTTDFRLALQSRTRLEQRFSEAGDKTGWRIRHFARFGWQPDGDVPLGLVLWNEVFWGLRQTDWGSEGGFDQHRLFIGPAFLVSSWARVEMGYLSVYASRPAGDHLAHVFALNFFLSRKAPRIATFD